MPKIVKVYHVSILYEKKGVINIDNNAKTHSSIEIKMEIESTVKMVRNSFFLKSCSCRCLYCYCSCCELVLAMQCGQA